MRKRKLFAFLIKSMEWEVCGESWGNSLLLLQSAVCLCELLAENKRKLQKRREKHMVPYVWNGGAATRSLSSPMATIRYHPLFDYLIPK